MPVLKAKRHEMAWGLETVEWRAFSGIASVKRNSHN